MAKGYWIVRVDIADADRYKAYTTANAGPPATARASSFVPASSRTRRARVEAAMR